MKTRAKKVVPSVQSNRVSRRSEALATIKPVQSTKKTSTKPLSSSTSANNKIERATRTSENNTNRVTKAKTRLNAAKMENEIACKLRNQRGKATEMYGPDCAEKPSNSSAVATEDASTRQNTSKKSGITIEEILGTRRCSVKLTTTVTDTMYKTKSPCKSKLEQSTASKSLELFETTSKRPKRARKLPTKLRDQIPVIRLNGSMTTKTDKNKLGCVEKDSSIKNVPPPPPPPEISLQHRQPVYKCTGTIAKPKPDEIFDDASIYDYLSNSQASQDDTTQNDPMKDVIEKLRKQNKIVLMKKQTRKKKPHDKSAAKPLWANVRNRTVVQRGLRELKENLKEVLSQSKSQTQTINISSESDHSNDHFQQADQVQDVTESVVPEEHNHVRPPVRNSKRTTNPIIYKMSLSKPNYQSTPIRTANPTNATNPAQPLGNSSPWRVVDEHVPGTFYFSSSHDHLPSYSSDVLATNSNALSRRQSTKPSIAINATTSIASKCSPNVSSNKESSKRLHYSVSSSGDDENMNSTGENNNPVILVDTINVSNIENCEPENHTEIRAKQASKTTKIVLGTPNTGSARIPLKPLTIKNVVFSPEPQMQPKRMLMKKPTSNTRNMHNGSSIVLFDGNPSISDSVNKETLPPQTKSPKKSSPSKGADKYFGFESDDSEADESAIAASSSVHNVDLQKELKNLRKFLPAPRTKSSAPSTGSRMKTRNIFKEAQNPQRIDKMFKAKVTALNDKVPPLHRSSIDAFDSLTTMQDHAGDITSDVPVLFDSILAPTDEKKRKSYTRVPKRKRKVSVSYTSGEEEEEDADVGENEMKKQRNNQYAKRKEIERKLVAKELDEFADQFNSMCEEIAQYELPIEKS